MSGLTTEPAVPGWWRRRHPRLSGTLHIRDNHGHDTTITLRGRGAVLTPAGNNLIGYGEIWAVHTDPETTTTSLMISYGRSPAPDDRETGLCPPGATVTLSGTHFTWHTPSQAPVPAEIPHQRTAELRSHDGPATNGPATTRRKPATPTAASHESTTATAAGHEQPTTPTAAGHEPATTTAANHEPTTATATRHQPTASDHEPTAGIAGTGTTDDSTAATAALGQTGAGSAGVRGNAAPTTSREPATRNTRVPLPRSGNRRAAIPGFRQRVSALVRDLTHPPAY
ncbi:NEDD4-like E3 ubiquitin-protein ligase WWP2 [Actinoplanes sp. SE50]|nr:NEDD4-like E3 ubiquitin-protein ligase WWP2 [Actinoplanes sp. SE50/110]ATO84731.1 NEDD4-like E3 ubiquitin-protein ligase WWP2 [Actinoplanes sp. SE50]SLM02141.1 hypothetical protein ACSP50_5379 [Actinoplanes sp. SE50/110]